jgi:hypothetical protein
LPFFFTSGSPEGDHSGRVVASHPDDCDLASLEQADRDPSVLLVPRRGILEMRAAKNQLGVQEVQPMLLCIRNSLALVPLEPHAVM